MNVSLWMTEPSAAVTMRTTLIFLPVWPVSSMMVVPVGSDLLVTESTVLLDDVVEVARGVAHLAAVVGAVDDELGRDTVRRPPDEDVVLRCRSGSAGWGCPR